MSFFPVAAAAVTGKKGGGPMAASVGFDDKDQPARYSLKPINGNGIDCEDPLQFQLPSTAPLRATEEFP